MAAFIQERNLVMIQTGDELGRAVLKALGIDHKNVADVVIAMNPNEVATVTITRFVDGDEADRLVEELRSYALVPTGGTVAPAPQQVLIVNRTSRPIDAQEMAKAIVARNLTRSHGGGSGG